MTNLETAAGAAERIISLGTLCITSTLLKGMGLKTESYPFDWIFSTPAMVAHCLDDDFATFLDRSQYEPVGPVNGTQCQHRFYSEYTGHTVPIFNHHNPATDEGYAYLRRCVDRFRQAAASDGKNAFVLINGPDDNISLFDRLSQSLARTVRSPTLLYLVHRQDAVANFRSFTTLKSTGADRLVEALTTSPPVFGTRFENPEDDQAVCNFITNFNEFYPTP